MTIFTRSIEQVSRAEVQRSASRIIIGVVFLFLVFIPLWGTDFQEYLGAYGYPAVFLISLISNAALFIPGPGIALVIAAGATLDPIMIGVIAGAGAALGELTGYLIGQGGQGLVSDKPIYWKIEKLMRKSGSFVIFMLAIIPNPLFDIGGLIAGALRMPVWKFLLSVWVGKSLRFGILAIIGAVAI